MLKTKLKTIKKTSFITIGILTIAAIIIFALRYNTKVIACKAFGEVSVNDYKVIHVTSYRLSQGKGAISISGRVFNNEKFIGILGRQFSFNYTEYDGMYEVVTTNSQAQTENTVDDASITQFLPPFYYKKGATQRIAFFPLGNGYRLDYNSFPIAYCQRP